MAGRVRDIPHTATKPAPSRRRIRVSGPPRDITHKILANFAGPDCGRGIYTDKRGYTDAHDGHEIPLPWRGGGVAGGRVPPNPAHRNTPAPSVHSHCHPAPGGESAPWNAGRYSPILQYHRTPPQNARDGYEIPLPRRGGPRSGGEGSPSPRAPRQNPPRAGNFIPIMGICSHVHSNPVVVVA